jgi:hypothetical protein
MRAAVAVVGSMLLASTASFAQQGKASIEKAPTGCIPCEALCRLCASRGLQDKDTRKCEAGCRSWGAMVGLKQVYVRGNVSLCGTGNYAPRCN